MPDLWVDVDVAVTVPVNILSLLDDTDFKTRETAVAYNAAGMDLVWNFITCAGAITQTAVTPTDGTGVYDWTHVGDGIYKIEIPASGGASINNDTEGFGWFTGLVTGVLPWRGPVIGFRRAALNDLLIEGSTASTNLEDFFDGTGYAGGTAKLTVDVAKWLGTAAATPTVAGVPEVDVTHVAGTAQTAGDIMADTNDIQARLPAALVGGRMDSSVGAVAAGVDFSATMKASINTEVDNAFDTAIPAVNTATSANDVLLDVVNARLLGTVAAGSHTAQSGDSFARLGAPAGASVSADIAAIEGQTDDIGVAGAGLTAVPWNAAWDAEVQSEVVDALNVDTYAEPGQGTPAATTTLVAKIGYLFKAWRNRTTQTASQYSLYNDDAVTIDHKATFSDDGVTGDRGEVATGP